MHYVLQLMKERESNEFSIASFVCDKVMSCSSASMDKLHSSEQQSSNSTSSKGVEYVQVNVDFYNASNKDTNIENFISALQSAISAVKPVPDKETEWRYA